MNDVSTFLAWLERQRAEREQLERAMHQHGVTKARVQFLRTQARRIDRVLQMGQLALVGLFLILRWGRPTPCGNPPDSSGVAT